MPMPKWYGTYKNGLYTSAVNTHTSACQIPEQKHCKVDCLRIFRQFGRENENAIAKLRTTSQKMRQNVNIVKFSTIWWKFDTHKIQMRSALAIHAKHVNVQLSFSINIWYYEHRFVFATIKNQKQNKTRTKMKRMKRQNDGTKWNANDYSCRRKGPRKFYHQMWLLHDINEIPTTNVNWNNWNFCHNETESILKANIDNEFKRVTFGFIKNHFFNSLKFGAIPSVLLPTISKIDMIQVVLINSHSMRHHTHRERHKSERTNMELERRTLDPH